MSEQRDTTGVWWEMWCERRSCESMRSAVSISEHNKPNEISCVMAIVLRLCSLVEHSFTTAMRLCVVRSDACALTHHPYAVTMSDDEYKALIELRVAAERLLGTSSVWKRWKATHELCALLLPTADYPTTPTTPEALVDGSDASLCVLNAYTVLQQEEELRRQLLLSSEWRSLQGVDVELKRFARTPLRKRYHLQMPHSAPSATTRAPCSNAMAPGSALGLDATSLHVSSSEPPSLLPPPSFQPSPPPSPCLTQQLLCS